MSGPLLPRCLALGLLCIGATARAEQPQRILIQVAVPAQLELDGLRADVLRLGEETAVGLYDDGRTPWDHPDDGVYVGVLEGAYTRTVSLVLVAEQAGQERVAFTGVLRTEDSALATLGFRLLVTPDGPKSVRVPVPYPGAGSEVYEALQLISAFGWALLVLAYVAFLVLGGGRRRKRSPARPSALAPSSTAPPPDRR